MIPGGRAWAAAALCFKSWTKLTYVSLKQAALSTHLASLLCGPRLLLKDSVLTNSTGYKSLDYIVTREIQAYWWPYGRTISWSKNPICTMLRENMEFQNQHLSLWLLWQLLSLSATQLCSLRACLTLIYARERKGKAKQQRSRAKDSHRWSDLPSKLYSCTWVPFNPGEHTPLAH